MPVLVNHGYSNSRIGDARDRTFPGHFYDLGKANTATTSIRDRSSLKNSHRDSARVFCHMDLKFETGNGTSHG